MHLHIHSRYSLLQGVPSVAELVDAAVRAQMPWLALTDTNALYGAVEFYDAARAAGVKPILGVEIVYAAEQCVLLAMDQRGYVNLCRIVTERRLRKDRFDIAACVGADSTGLIALTACGSLLRRLAAVMPAGRLYAERRADEVRSFEPHCPTLNDGYAIGAGLDADLTTVATRLGIPFAATVNVNFLAPEDRPVHTVLSAVRENMRLGDMAAHHERLAGPHSYFMTREHMAARLPDAAEALRNTQRIAEMCNLTLELGVHRFPRADLPAGETATRRLHALAEAGARRRYGGMPAPVRERLDRELGVIARLHFCDYFLIVHDICEFAVRAGIPCVGRGSAGNSLVAYSLGISAVDPLHYDLYFERFLNEFRTDMPDIDLDFCWRRRDEVIRYVYERYGADRVAMISTHTRLRMASAFRDVARVLGLPQREIDALSRRLPGHGARSIREAVALLPEMADFPIDREPWRSVVALAERVRGGVRHLGIHPGGVVIADRALTDYTALERSTKGIVVTQYEMKSIARMGLVKMDLLGQRGLSTIAEAAAAVKRERGIVLDTAALPTPAHSLEALLRAGRSIGCFQIESPGMRQLLQMVRAESVMDIIRALSLIRPGPSSSGMKDAFIRRVHGREPVTYATPLLADALKDTQGVMLYQEDLLRVARDVAGFSLAEGDELRKGITKRRARVLGVLHKKFIAGAVARDVAPDVAAEIWRQITCFASYSYCKAHACTYGHLAWQAMWLKAYYPAEFFASLIANRAGFYDMRTYLEEARRCGVRILPPCVNRSRVETCARNGCIRPGLEHIRRLTRTTVHRILTERPFRSLDDFRTRVHPTPIELENLTQCGAFDALGLRRQETPLATRVLLELSILGFSHSGHPLDAWQMPPDAAPLTGSYKLPKRVGRAVTVAGWLVTSRRAVTQARDYMKFLTLEDRYGVMEAALFPDVYRRSAPLLTGPGCYLVHGIVRARHGVATIIADEVQALSPIVVDSPGNFRHAAGTARRAPTKLRGLPDRRYGPGCL